MTQESAVRTSKYIKPAREEKIFEKTVVFFLFSLFVMPQYFGLPTPLFDFTLLGVEKTVRYLLGFLYLMTILGVVEYAMGRSPFSYLETIKGIYTGRFIRSGNYRIMSSCTHSLGYGLLLVAVAPLSCFDYRKNEVNVASDQCIPDRLPFDA